MYRLIFKKVFDISVAICILPICLIVFIPVSILIYLEDRGPIFYCAERIGKNEKFFLMYKFRTMKVNSPDIRSKDGSTYSEKSDSRVTYIGKFLRETSIDEIPQFLNIFLGEMSLIGPRPEVVLRSNDDNQINFLIKVLPGITGYNQAYFRNNNNREAKYKNDLYYQNNVSFILDMKILFKTIVTVLARKKIYKN